MLERYMDVTLNRIIMVGCIINNDFYWEKYLEARRVSAILNDSGNADFLPVLASIIHGAGDSGVSFFVSDSDDVLKIKTENCGHSSLLHRPEHWDDIWLPFIRGELKENALPQSEKDSRTVTYLRLVAHVILFIPRLAKRAMVSLSECLKK